MARFDGTRTISTTPMSVKLRRAVLFGALAGCGIAGAIAGVGLQQGAGADAIARIELFAGLGLVALTLFVATRFWVLTGQGASSYRGFYAHRAEVEVATRHPDAYFAAAGKDGSDRLVGATFFILASVVLFTVYAALRVAG